MAEQGGLDKEAKVGAMLRHMTGDVAAGFREFHKSLYDDTDVGISCAKWHWALVMYSPAPIAMRSYVSMIQIAYTNRVNLDKLEEWRKLMRVILPEEFMAKMSLYSQVPQIAVMDNTEYKAKAEIKDATDVVW